MNNIITKQSGIILTSLLDDIIIHCEYISVRLVVSRPGGTVIFDEILFAYDGEAVLSDFAALVEADMQATKSCLQGYTVEIYGTFGDVSETPDDTYTVSCLYHNSLPPSVGSSVLLAQNFLTTLSTRRLAKGSAILLYAYLMPGEARRLDVSLAFSVKGSPDIRHFAFSLNADLTAPSEGIYPFGVEYSEIINRAALFSSVDASAIDLKSVTVACDERSVTYYVDPALDPAQTLFFYNPFNVLEAAVLPMKQGKVTEVEQSFASLGRTTVGYDLNVTQSRKVEAGPLTADEAEWVTQLFCAHELYAYHGADLLPILITEVDSEVRLHGDEPNTVTFSWRYCDNRPVVTVAEQLDIFTNPYTLQFN